MIPSARRITSRIRLALDVSAREIGVRPGRGAPTHRSHPPRRTAFEQTLSSASLAPQIQRRSPTATRRGAPRLKRMPRTSSESDCGSKTSTASSTKASKIGFEARLARPVGDHKAERLRGSPTEAPDGSRCNRVGENSQRRQWESFAASSIWRARSTTRAWADTAGATRSATRPAGRICSSILARRGT